MLRDKEGKENDGRPPHRDLCRLQIRDAILGNKGWEGVEGGGKRKKEPLGCWCGDENASRKGRRGARASEGAIMQFWRLTAQEKHHSQRKTNTSQMMAIMSKCKSKNCPCVGAGCLLSEEQNSFCFFFCFFFAKARRLTRLSNTTTASITSISVHAPQPGVCSLSALALTFARHLNLCMWGIKGGGGV